MNTEDVVKETRIADFSDAKAAAEQAELPAERERQTEQQAAGSEQEAAGEQAIEEIAEAAVETADVAAKAAAEKDTELKEALAQIERLSDENRRLKESLAQQSEITQEELIKPELDLASLVNDDEETVAAKKAQYEQELKKYWEEVEKRKAEEKANTIGALAKIPELAGFDEMLPQIEQIILNNRILNSPDVPLDEKYVTAYAIARGVNAINEPAPDRVITVDRFLELYNGNPEFQKAIAAQKKQAVSAGREVPPLSASSGAGSAALNIPEKAKTFEDAKSIISRIFNQ